MAKTLTLIRESMDLMDGDPVGLQGKRVRVGNDVGVCRGGEGERLPDTSYAIAVQVHVGRPQPGDDKLPDLLQQGWRVWAQKS